MHDSSLQPGIRDELLAKLQDILPYLIKPQDLRIKQSEETGAFYF